MLKPTFHFIPFLFLFLLFQGCAVWDFVEVRYQNATGYFNTYYNAKSLFDEAIEEIEEQQTSGQAGMGKQIMTTGGGLPPEDDQMMLKLASKEFGVSSAAVQKLDKVIEKCSRLLVHYPKSKWVDNALYMIGRSYYYKREYGRAERKFKELLEGFPDGSLFGEGLLWRGKNFMMMERFDLSESTLREAIAWAEREEEPDIVSDAHYALGELYLLQNRSSDAVTSFTDGLKSKSGKYRRIQLQLALADELEKIGDKKAAARAYAAIIELNPSRELLFQAQLNYARLSRETNDIDNAINTLVDMLDNPMFIEYDGDIQLEIGHLYVAMEEFAGAVEQFQYVDTTFRNQPASAEANYALGRLYEVQAKDYDRAFDKYSAAKLAYPGIKAAKLGGERAEALGEYRKIRNKMFDLDTLLFFVLKPDSLERRDSLQAIVDSLDRKKEIAEGKPEKDMTEEELFAERFARRRPHGRNTGRINPWVNMPSSTPVVAPIQVGSGKPLTVATNATVPLYRRHNLRELSSDSILTVLSAMRMEMGWVMFDRVGNYDSAMFYYQLAIDGILPDSLLANAYYTMAAISRMRGDSSLASDYEDLLIRKLPTTRYAHSIMQSRGLPIPKDTLTIAREAYDRAATTLETRSVTEGLHAMQTMAANYPNSSQAARANLAMALTYETIRGEEEKALEIYRHMVAAWPNSEYTKRAKDVLDALEKGPPQDEPPPVATPKVEPKKEQKKPTLRDLELEAERRGKTDPTLDDDFPLGLPGQKNDRPKDPRKQQPNVPGGSNPLPLTPNPGEDIPLPGNPPEPPKK